ncbi:putative ribonuclease H-like domain-containing protein, partial [Tanacetum coccineum]
IDHCVRLLGLCRIGRCVSRIAQCDTAHSAYPMYKAFIEPDLKTAHNRLVNKLNPFTEFQSPTYEGNDVPSGTSYFFKCKRRSQGNVTLSVSYRTVEPEVAFADIELFVQFDSEKQPTESEFVLIPTCNQMRAAVEIPFKDEATKEKGERARMIALGTAHALEYLHEVCSPSVHKNLKLANILLDSELNPHLSDYGLASLVSGLDDNGYIAPEVSMFGQYMKRLETRSNAFEPTYLYTMEKVLINCRNNKKLLSHVRAFDRHSNMVERCGPRKCLMLSSCKTSKIYNKGYAESFGLYLATSTAITSVKDWTKKLETKFRKKIEILLEVNHENFVNLIGYCEEQNPFTRMMVFESHHSNLQEEGIDYDEMDVKSAFLYDTIDEEVYVSQHLGFVDPKFPKKVYKVVKALYGLNQAPWAWYATLSTFLLKNGYRRGTIDKTRFIKKDKYDIVLVQMSSMGELAFLLGLQVKQKEDGIFISRDKYVAETLKKFDFASVKTATTPIKTQKPLTKDEEASDVDVHLYRSMIGSLMYLTASRPDIMFAVCACSRFQVTPKTSHLNVVKRIFRYLKGKPKLGLWYPRVSSFDLESYSDSDYAGANLDRKSTTRGCQFLGRRLISWQCKKQTIVATSTTEAKYVDAANCCGQVLWIQNQMLDYGFNFMNTKIYIDNESTICIVKNPVFHSKTKHIEIRHHFIRDAYEKKLIQVLKIHTDDNVADLLTKDFDVRRLFCCIVYEMILVRKWTLDDMMMIWGSLYSFLRATYGAELVSAASLINTAKPKLSTARLGWCCSKVFNNGFDAWIGSKMQFGLDLREKLVLPGKVGAARHKDSAARQKFVLLVTVITVGGNLEFHEIVDFLTSISIHLALTVSPTIYISYIEQFWNIASSQTVNDEKQIHATVNSKALVVTEAFIRSYLLLNDAVGTACLTNEAIFQNLALMGYEGELNKLTFQKALFSPQWNEDAEEVYVLIYCADHLSWQGQYGRGDKKYPTIMLEAVASQDLWIWHAFYGMAGANNDINVLDNSPLFDDPINDFRHCGSKYVGKRSSVTLMGITWLMEFTRSGQVSSNHSRLQLIRSIRTLNSVKKVHEKMSNVLSVFSKDVGDLFNNRPVHTSQHIT